MARLANSALAGLNGNMGELIFYQRNGVTYVRRKPQKWSSSQKKNAKVSDLNKLYQNKFSLAQKYLSGLNRAIRFGFQAEVVGAKTARNACISYTLLNCFVFDGPNYKIDPALFKFSIGNLLGAEDAKAERNENGILITWKNNSWVSSARPDDQAFLVIHNPKNSFAHMKEFGNYRSKGELLFPNNLNDSEGEWHVYLAFSQINRRFKKITMSDSLYLGVL